MLVGFTRYGHQNLRYNTGPDRSRGKRTERLRYLREVSRLGRVSPMHGTRSQLMQAKARAGTSIFIPVLAGCMFVWNQPFQVWDDIRTPSFGVCSFPLQQFE